MPHPMRPRADRLLPWLPLFGAPGEHRLAAAASAGRRADTDVTAWGQDDETPAPRPLPRPPWEYAQAGPEQHAGGRRRMRRPQEAAMGRTESGPSWFDPLQPDPRSGEQAGKCGRPVTRLSRRRRRRRGRQHRMVERGGGRGGRVGQLHLGMPIRIPQASLAPQLRAQEAALREAEARGVEARGWKPADGGRGAGRRRPIAGGDPLHVDLDAARLGAGSRRRHRRSGRRLRQRN